MSSSSNLLLYLSAREAQILSTLIEEAARASCILSGVGCSGRIEEDRGVEREKELDVGVDANRRLFAGGAPSLKVRTGEDAKDWEREESGGGTKDFVNFGGRFEVEALALIAQGVGLNKSRLADHMMEHGPLTKTRLRVIQPSRPQHTFIVFVHEFSMGLNEVMEGDGGRSGNQLGLFCVDATRAVFLIWTSIVLTDCHGERSMNLEINWPVREPRSEEFSRQSIVR